MVAVFVAFGHFLAFFALTAAVVLQLALLAESMSADTARRIQRADRAAGLSVVAVLAFGLLRVFYFEKGADYYFANTWFLVKLGLFIAAILISLYPTLKYLRWNAVLAQGNGIELEALVLKRMKSVIHWELVLIIGILLCASLMARGFGM